MPEATSSALDEAIAGIVGCVDVEPTSEGLVALRVSRRWLRSVADPIALALARMPAGVRLRVRTDAPWVELLCTLTLVRTPKGIQQAVFEVCSDDQSMATVCSVEGNVVGTDPTGITSFEPGGSTRVRLPLAQGGQQRVYEIWLPPAAQLALHDVRIPQPATLQHVPDPRPRWIHYGSSISNCLDAPRPSAAWPAVAAAHLRLSLTNMGLAGQCQIDQFAARTIRDTPCELITVKLGINVVTTDSMRERAFVSAAHGFLDTVRDGHPTTPIVVISPVACPVVENHVGPTRPGNQGVIVREERPALLAQGSLSLRRVRQLLETVVAARRSDGDSCLYGLNGMDIFGLDDVGLLADGVHPRPEAWPMMGERMARLTIGLGLGYDWADGQS